MMSGGLIDKVYIGLDNAPAAFDIKGRILGPNGTNLEYIRSETGVVAVLKGDKLEQLHLALHLLGSGKRESVLKNNIEFSRAAGKNNGSRCLCKQGKICPENNQIFFKKMSCLHCRRRKAV